VVYFHSSPHERVARTTKDENGTERSNVLTFKRFNAFSKQSPGEVARRYR